MFWKFIALPAPDNRYSSYHLCFEIVPTIFTCDEASQIYALVKINKQTNAQTKVIKVNERTDGQTKEENETSLSMMLDTHPRKAAWHAVGGESLQGIRYHIVTDL